MPIQLAALGVCFWRRWGKINCTWADMHPVKRGLRIRVQEWRQGRIERVIKSLDESFAGKILSRREACSNDWTLTVLSDLGREIPKVPGKENFRESSRVSSDDSRLSGRWKKNTYIYACACVCVLLPSLSAITHLRFAQMCQFLAIFISSRRFSAFSKSRNLFSRVSTSFEEIRAAD